MKTFLTRAILGVVLAACCSTFASAQVPLLVTYRADLGADGYGIEILDKYVHPSLRSGVNLTAPDGTVFPIGHDTTPVRVDSLTLSELTTRFTGDWTITDNWNLPVGTPAQHHRFSLDAAALTSFPLTTPQILSPPDGARLAYYFDVSSTNFSAPSHTDILLSQDNIRYWHSLPTVYLYGAGLRGAVEARAMSFNFTTIGVTPLGASPAHLFYVNVFRGNFSAPKTWTVGVFVPEPSAIALTSIGLLGLAALRRRS